MCYLPSYSHNICPDRRLSSVSVLEYSYVALTVLGADGYSWRCLSLGYLSIVFELICTA